MLIIMITTSIALTLAWLTSITFRILTFREKMVSNLNMLGEVIGYNSTSAVIFDDPEAAGETLSSLKAEQNIISACIYTNDGNVFATYVRNEQQPEEFPLQVKNDIHEFSEGGLTFFQSIIFNEEKIGTLFFKADLHRLYALIRGDILFITLLLLACLFLAYLVSSELQRIISKPIFDLVETAKYVSDNKDYSVRASKYSADELGILVDAFNEMLAEIEAHDAQMQKKERYFRSLVDEAKDLIIFLNDKGTIFYQSPSVEEVLGYHHQELIGRKVDVLIHPDNIEKIMGIFTSKGDEGEGFITKQQFNVKHKKGTWHKVEGKFNNSFEDDNVFVMVINSSDIH